MGNRIPSFRHVSTFVLSVLIFAASVLSYLVFPVVQQRGQIWNGYYVLLIPESEPGSDAVARLQKAGFDGIVSEQTAEVTFTTYEGSQRLPVEALGSRFDPLDPRYDSYMRNIGAYFHTSLKDRRSQILYVPSPPTPFETSRRVARAFAGSGVKWSLVEWDAREGGFFLGAFLFVGAVIIWKSRGVRLVLALGLFPWIIYVFLGAASSFSEASLVYFAWAHLVCGTTRYLEEYVSYGNGESMRHTLFWRILFLAAVIVAALIFHADDGLFGALPLFTGTIGTAAITLASWLAIRFMRSRRDHRIFHPVPILPVSAAVRRKYALWPTLPLIFVIVLFAPLTGNMLPHPDAPVLPRPEKGTANTAFTFHQIRTRFAAKNDSSLPDISDYVAHRAYQRGLLFGQPYGVPSEGRTITLSHYNQRDGKLLKSEETVMVYNDAWLRSALAEAPPGSLQQLLISQGRPIGVVAGQSAAIYSQTSRLLRHSILVVLVFSPFLVGRTVLQWAGRRRAADVLLRRSKQEA